MAVNWTWHEDDVGIFFPTGPGDTETEVFTYPIADPASLQRVILFVGGYGAWYSFGESNSRLIAMPTVFVSVGLGLYTATGVKIRDLYLETRSFSPSIVQSYVLPSTLTQYYAPVPMPTAFEADITVRRTARPPNGPFNLLLSLYAEPYAPVFPPTTTITGHGGFDAHIRYLTSAPA